MLKMKQTGKRTTFFSLCLSGVLMLFYAGPRTAAQDAPPNPAVEQAMPSDASAPEQAQPEGQAAPQGQPPAPNQAPPPEAQAPYTAPTPNQSNQPDPPSRAARISDLEGSVSFQPGGQGDWGSAVKNRPVTVGDKIWSDKSARAEIQTGPLTLHLGSMTALSFLNLDGNTTQVRIAEGSVNFRVREMREGDVFEVDTPNAAFSVRQAGAFRIDVAENGDGTRVTVIRGAGDVLAGGQTYTVHLNERAEFSGVDNNIQYVVHGAPPPDSLDRWANDRDLREDNSVSARYVNRDVPGYADLDDHGTWSDRAEALPGEEGEAGQVQPEGPVWYPNDVPPDWAPYSDGSWNYVGPWGWSWVGYEPWGFAPYHYGRWSLYGGRWGWYPGPIWAAPYYGPAFVGFLGGGFGVGVGFGFGFGFGGGIGWFPLGWGEPFHPWYHAGVGYVHNINVSNTHITNTTISNSHFNYAYAHNTNAVTAASRNAFTNGERVNRGSARVSASALQNARVSSNLSVAPTRASYTGATSLNAHVATPSAAVQNRSVVTRATPSTAAHSAIVSASRGTASSGTRNWAAQGNTTDRGVAPLGAGHSSIGGNSTQTARVAQNDRPQWARAGATNSATARTASNAATNYNRPPSASTNRSYQPAQRSAPTYNSNRGSSSVAPRTYSAPRANTAPSRGSSAPARSGGSSGGGSRGGSGGSPHGGGGGGGGRH